ncbi:hypothetical protein J2741_000919 [Methanolinea mesophila]|uniref:hypothetical protein n=1 Tax=Methanolinea mesophila TaxID=547055 RepID=UPI001AE72C13|nr:hypothetical protein [Methanolinea mesophila]MBP1928372.1 hypothetical protein [Methanolinea mesophila]
MVSELGMRLWRLGMKDPSIRPRTWGFFGFFSPLMITLRVFLGGGTDKEEQLPLPERQSSSSFPSLFFRPVLILQR